MSQSKRMKFTKHRSFKKKRHKQQFKHNEQVKEAISEAKEAMQTNKQNACLAKLDEGIELINRSETEACSSSQPFQVWVKTIGEYIANELPDNDDNP